MGGVTLTDVNAATCAALSAVFPLILITVVLERPRVSIKIRRAPWFRKIVMPTIAASLIGTIVSLIGVQMDGFGPVAGAFAWVVVAAAVLGLGTMALMIVATDEVEEERPVVE